MSTLDEMILWPSTLPLPFVDYGGQPMHATLASPAETPRIERRSRFRASVVAISVKWVLNIAEYIAFKAFLLEDLGNGAALFLIELRYPKSSALTVWKARFTSAYNAQYHEGVWEVSGDLELLDAAGALVPAAPEVGWVNFFVMPEGTPFETADEFLYCVKEV